MLAALRELWRECQMAELLAAVLAALLVGWLDRKLAATMADKWVH